MTVILNGASLSDKSQLHAELKKLLSLPDYYGANADALYDCLSERLEPVNLIVMNLNGYGAEEELWKVMRVVEDLGGDVKTI